MLEPSVVFVMQGEKKMWLGNQSFAYDSSRFLVTSLALPANGEVMLASREKPCLGLTFKIDLRIMAELMVQSDHPHKKSKNGGSGLGLGTVTPAILKPVQRLIETLGEPEAIPVIAPLVRREIHYRLLMSDQADKIRQIVSVESQAYRIAKATDWLRCNFFRPVRIDELAAYVHMSTPAFHLHFRQLTQMSPLQYQKWLRLSEAKRLMLNEQYDVTRAAYKVGYESPSQFSREYSRLFGSSPKKDIGLLRSLE